jgi:hypothetical protein
MIKDQQANLCLIGAKQVHVKAKLMKIERITLATRLQTDTSRCCKNKKIILLIKMFKGNR